MVAAAKLPIRMSVRDFLDWESGDSLRYELVDGEPRGTVPAETMHGFLQGRLAALIIAHLEREKRPFSLVVAPGVRPRMMSAHNVRLPDLGVTCSPLHPGQSILPDPVLLIEILSTRNQAKTWSNVCAYTSIPTVQEILVLYSDKVGIELLRRSAAGAWPEQTEPILVGDLTLTSIGFSHPLVDLYSRTGLTG